MDILPLPSHPSLENYKKRAMDLAKVAKTEQPGAIQVWGLEWVEMLAESIGASSNSFVYASFRRAIDDISLSHCAEEWEFTLAKLGCVVE